MTEHIAVIASQDGKNVTPSTWKRYAFAKELKKHTKAGISFILIGPDTEQAAGTLSSRTGCPVIAADLPEIENYHTEFYKKALERVLGKHPHSYVLAPHSSSGLDYAPSLSIALNGFCVTAVEGMEIDNGRLCFIRSLHNGKVQAVLECPGVCASTPLVMTVQQGASKPDEPDGDFSPHVIRHRFDFNEEQMIYKGRLPSPSQGSALSTANIIVSGGRGIEDEENYQLIEALARLFPRAATGASRPICDYGWAPYQNQVGATGNIVSPALYIACGISGATQHLEGIRDARFIVAVNKDADAPIFQVADICVVEDLVTFIPLVRQAWEKKKHVQAQDT